MHTILVIAGGMVLLLCGQLLARFTGITSQTQAALYFVPLWLLITSDDMWAGVQDAGHSLMEELPTFLLVLPYRPCWRWHYGAGYATEPPCAANRPRLPKAYLAKQKPPVVKGAFAWLAGQAGK